MTCPFATPGSPSRDDAASFLGIYTAKGILAVDPFVSPARRTSENQFDAWSAQ
jgi:hypothetical protein